MNAPTPAGHHFFVTSLRNAEGLLMDELRSLGVADPAETRAGVAFTGPLPLAYRVCLWSRVAGRVILRLATFPLSDPDDLYQMVRDIPWEDHLAVSGTLAVEVTSSVRRGPLAGLNTHFAEQRMKDAVVDRFRERTGSRPGVDLARPSVRINVHLDPESATLGLDLSGEALHRRGYRLGTGDAPLKENLAAAILLRAGWPRIAAVGGALVDPMCGSGTLLIEGALMAGDVAPGLFREYYGFCGWSGFDPAPWNDLLDEARERRERGLRLLPPLLGADIDAKAIATARANARRAGLAGRIVLEHRDLRSLVAPRVPSAHSSVDGGGAPESASGLVVVNPPYGKRIGETPDLVSTYETLGERLKAQFPGWEAAVFTGNPELGAHLGLRAHRVNIFYNGPLPCKLLLFHIEGDSGRPLTRAHPRPGPGAEMFANRVRKNLKRLRAWAAREHLECYRVYDADLPEYAAAVDLYADWAHIQEYAAPSTVDPVQARRRLKDMVSVLPEILGIPSDHVVLKVRRQQKGSSQYQKLGGASRMLEVTEGDLRFLVNLTDYLDTGLFLDHRPTRRLLRDLAAGRRFLNLFAYTGSATVYAAAGGAISTTTVDLSPVYLDWARRNLELNGFTGPQHGFVRADCVEWLDQATGEFDLIFLDAPTFSNSKSMTAPLDIQRDHSKLIQASTGLLSADGVLIFGTNYRRFKLDAALTHQYTVSDITKQTIPPDFARNPRAHACFHITPQNRLDRERRDD